MILTLTLTLVAGAVTRMLKRKLSMAWEQWQFWYEDLLRQRDLLASAMARIQKLKLSQVLTLTSTLT